jgi:Protein of unknown function (DUF3574)
MRKCMVPGTKRFVSIAALSISLLFTPTLRADEFPSVSARHAERTDHDKPPPFVGDRFARTELYFGTARANGAPVTEAEFQGFLDDKITPAFPDGLTLLKGLGQFRGSDGITIEETSFLVILLYPADARRESSEKIEAIRQAYTWQFGQESVLRSDDCCERVGF